MQDNLHDYRKSYERSALERDNLEANPMQQFRTWFYEAKASNTIAEVNAMTIATIGQDGFPKSRVVLLKSYSEEGFVFYTNYNSTKGQDLSAQPQTCLSFFWPALERQIIIKGSAEKLSAQQSDNYFASRPKGSQLGALVSPQSQVIENRSVLEDKLKQLEQAYANKGVERPEHWGGFLVRPKSIEFWQGRPNRLHDRFLYSLQDDFDWTIERLAP